VTWPGVPVTVPTKTRIQFADATLASSIAPDSAVFVVAHVIAASVAAQDAPLLLHSCTVKTTLVAAFEMQLMCVTVSAASARVNRRLSPLTGDSITMHLVD
jgi:hypothetical protein